MTAGATRYRETVETYGLSPTHRQIIAWIPEGANVLELGCSSGYVGEVLLRDKHCRVTGVELDSGAAEEARARGLRVVLGSLDDPEFRRSLTERFDVVVAADVLEHLRAPADALVDVKRWVQKGGSVVLAVPNIATWNVRFRLFFGGHFDYQETGIMDRTHAHFFTWETFHALLREQGWTIRETMVDGWELPLLQTLLFDWPVGVRDRAEAATRTAGRRGVWNRVVHGAASWAVSTGASLAKPLVRWAPNLTAPHVAVLLSPPDDAS